VVARFVAEHEGDIDTDTRGLCQSLVGAAGLLTNGLVLLWSAWVWRRPGARSAYYAALASAAVNAALQLYQPSDADSLQELVDDALEATAWRVDAGLGAA
jgi:hypothetical protein